MKRILPAFAVAALIHTALLTADIALADPPRHLFAPGRR
jgi:hypothetical protein